MRRLAKCPPFRKRVVWLVGLFLVLGLSPGRSVRAEERFVPLGLGPGSAYEFRASLPRSTGSIELILAATSNGSAPDAEARPMCVLANASDEQTRLAVLVRSDRKALGLSNGRSLDWVPIRLDDGLLHHVILIAIGERTEVFLDTKYQGCFRVGFGEDQELPWTLGAFPGDRDPFRGKVATVRLWDRPLRGNDFPALETYGMPDLALAGLRDLTACSFFTNRGQEVVSYRGNIRRATVVGSVTTETGPQLIPTGARLQALRVHSREVPDPASPPPANTNTSNNTPARKLSQILDVEPVFQFTRFDRQPIPGAPSYTPRTWAIVQFREEQERLLQMLARAARWRHTRLMDLFATEPFQNFGPSWVDYLHLAAVDEALKPFEKGTPARDEIHTLEKAIVPLTPDLVRPGLSETQKAILVSEPVVRLYEALETLLESRLVPPNDPPESAEPRAAARLSWKRSQVETLAQCARRNLEQVALWFEASEIKNPWNRGDTFHAIERLIATFTDPLANAATRQAALDAAADPRAALANLGEENAKDADDAPLPRQRLAALRNWLDRLESATEPNRQTNATPGQPATSTPITIPFKQDPNDAGKDEAIAMIAGTRGPVLSTLRLITNARMLEVIGNHPAREPFSTKVPLSGRFAGFINTYSDEGLSSLQPLFDDPPPDAPAPAWAENHVLLPPRIDLGRFHPEGVRKPTRNDKLITDLAGPLNDPESATKSGNAAADPRQFRLARNLFDPSTGRVQPHANYTTFPVANLWFTVTGEPIVAIDDLDRPADRQVTLFRFSPVPGDRSRFTGETDDHRRLELSLLENGDFVLTGLDARYPTSAVRYVRPLLSAEAGPNGDKLPWGATFSSDHRPVLSEFNVRGYHVPRLDARNYQLGTGTSHNVFEWPDDESTDYQTTAAGKIIPRGLFYRNDREGNGSVRTTVSMTSQEHQEAWSCNLGLSGGYGGMAAFSLDTSYQSESATMQEQETGSTLAMTHEVKHALVLDRSTMRLDPTFTERVERLRDLYLAGIADDALNAECARLVDDFGTNYPYAVCYGGTAYQEKKYESSRLSRMQGSGFSVQAKLETEFLAARAGVSGGYSQNSKDTTGTAARNEADSIITIGGEIAHGGGWSVPDRSEVPVLLDLRPLTELLSPLYFDDKIVWTELRTRIGNILEFMADEASTSYTVPPPHMVRVRLTELVQVENERGGSLAVDVLTGNPALDALIAATRKGERPQVQLDLIQQLVAAGAYFRVNQPSILVSGAPSASGGKDKWSGARVLKTNDNSFKVWGPPIGLTGAAYVSRVIPPRKAGETPVRHHWQPIPGVVDAAGDLDTPEEEPPGPVWPDLPAVLPNVLVPRLKPPPNAVSMLKAALGDGDDAALWDILPLSGTIANRIAHWSGKIGVGPLSPFGSLRAPLPDGSWSGTIYELSGSLSSLALDQKRPDPKKIPTETVIKYLLAEPRPNPERMIGAFARSIDSFNRPLGSDSMHPAAITFGLPALKGEPNAPGESTKYRIQLGLLQYVPPALRLGVTNDNLDGKQDLTTTFESSTRFRMRIQDVLGSDGKSLIGRGARIANRAMTTPEGYVSSLAELTGAKTLPEPTQGDVVVFEYDPKATSTIDGTLVLVNDLGTKNHLKFAIDRPMLGAR